MPVPKPSTILIAEDDDDDFLLTEQHAINGKKIPYLIDSDWWADLSEAVNGLTIEFVRIEFAKMAVWFRNNPKKLPTEKGVRRFVANWFQTAAEDRRRQVTSYAQSARR